MREFQVVYIRALVFMQLSLIKIYYLNHGPRVTVSASLSSDAGYKSTCLHVYFVNQSETMRKSLTVEIDLVDHVM